MKSTGLPNLKPINKQQTYSLYQLSKWNQQIDMQRLKTVHDQQDIKKERKIDKQSCTLLNDSIQQVEQDAVIISKQIQQEQTKFEHLLVLVKNAQQQIYSQKLSKYEDVINNKQTDEYQEQKKILQEKQRILEKIFQKLNASDFEISKKVDAIRSLKKDRGFHSNLFDKLQREYFDVEFYYKQLLIQRTLKEKLLEMYTAEFNKVLQKSQEENLQINNGTNYEKGFISLFKRQVPQQQQQKQQKDTKVPELPLSRPHQVHYTQAKTKKQLAQSRRAADEMRRFEFKKKVSHILNDFGCNSFEEFALKDINFLSQSHQQVLTQANIRYQQIDQLRNAIKQLQKQINEKRENRKNPQSKKKSNISSYINKFQDEISKQKGQVCKFKLEFYQIFGEFLSQKQGNKSQNEAQQILQKIQTSKEDCLNFTQDMQVLKQAMAYMNDKVLKGPFSFLLSPKISSPKKSEGRTSTQVSPQRAKAKKESIAYKVQNQQNETSNSNRKSQGLNEILKTYQNDNEKQKSKKAQKQDSPSLLTQKEFIFQSKRIITEVNKKSIFGRVGNNSKK